MLYYNYLYKDIADNFPKPRPPKKDRQMVITMSKPSATAKRGKQSNLVKLNNGRRSKIQVDKAFKSFHSSHLILP